MVATFTVLLIVILFGIYLVGCALINKKVAKLEARKEELSKKLKESLQTLDGTAVDVMVDLGKTVKLIDCIQEKKRALKWRLLVIGCVLLVLLAIIGKYLA